jgi:hypothetical protein
MFIWTFILYDPPNKQEDYFPKKHKICDFDEENVDFEVRIRKSAYFELCRLLRLIQRH